MGSVTSQRHIVCPHGTGCDVRFTAERCDGAVAVTVDDIGCAECSRQLAGNDGASREFRSLLVRNYLTRAL